jgi:hypothetical protein
MHNAMHNKSNTAAQQRDVTSLNLLHWQGRAGQDTHTTTTHRPSYLSLGESLLLQLPVLKRCKVRRAEVLCMRVLPVAHGQL